MRGGQRTAGGEGAKHSLNSAQCSAAMIPGLSENCPVHGSCGSESKQGDPFQKPEDSSL